MKATRIAEISGRALVTRALLLAAAAAALLVPGEALAQQSASYRLEEHVLNAGGSPAGGSVPASAGYKITLGAIGEGLAGTALSSASYRMDGGFGSAYPPPGEATGLMIAADKQTLSWNHEKSAGVYNLYRDLLSGLSGLGYGVCHQQSLPTPTATDAGVPPAGDGYYYLATVENRLGEEGTKGFDGAGGERPNGAPCP